MSNDTRRYDRAVSHLTRRRALAGGATMLAAGGTLLAVGSGPTRAQVSIESLTIPDAEFAAESVVPVIDVTAAYQYDVGQEPVGDVRVALAVDGTEVSAVTLRTDRSALSGETDLSGRVTDSDAWTATDFSVGVGESIQRELGVELAFAVRDSNGKTIVGDTATASPTMTVDHPQESEWTATVGGEGSIRTATPSN